MQRLPVSASDFNHMFTPLSIERMFQRSPSMGGDHGDTRTSIMGMLWSGSTDDASLEGGAGDTLKLLLSHGSNPTESAGGPVACASPPDTVTSQGSGPDDQGYAQYAPPARSESVRRLPPIPSSPHLRSASRMSLASSAGAGQRRTALNEHYAREGIPQSLRIHDTGAWGLSAPAGGRPMGDAGDYGGLPLQVHSAVGTRHPAADLSLRHEVLDK
ncbi:hypothetical protein GGI06_002910, partial [Coemansia sp. S85]